MTLKVVTRAADNGARPIGWSRRGGDVKTAR
jgi:hypothetical protein